MNNFLEIFTDVLAWVLAFYFVIIVIAILWFFVFPFIATTIIKICKIFDELSDKLFKKNQK